MSSCSLICHKQAWWLNTTLQPKHHNSLRQHTDAHAASHAAGPPWLSLTASQSERGEEEEKWVFPDGVKSAVAFTHLVDSVFILQETCFFGTKPNSFLFQSFLFFPFYLETLSHKVLVHKLASSGTREPALTTTSRGTHTRVCTRVDTCTQTHTGTDIATDSACGTDMYM